MEIESIEKDSGRKETMDQLRADFGLTGEELRQLLDMQEREYDNFYADEGDGNDSEERLRICQEMAALPCLFKIDDDERLRAYMQELQTRYQIDVKLLAKILRQKEETIWAIRNNSGSVSIEDRYSVGMKVVYLLFLFSARPEKGR